VGDYVVIGTNAILLGPIRDGDHAKVWANSFVIEHVNIRMECFGALPTSTTVQVRDVGHPVRRLGAGLVSSR